MGLFILVATLLGAVVVADNTGQIDLANVEIPNPIEHVITVEENAETGLSDVTVVGGKTFSLDIQPLDYSKLND